MKGRYFLTALCITLFATLLYVRSRFLVVELSYRVSKARQIEDSLKQLRDELSLELAVLKSPKRIQGLAYDKLGLSSKAAPIKVHIKSSGGQHDF